MSDHTITKAEMQSTKIKHLLAASSGGRKRLELCYDIGRKRLTFLVTYLNDGTREYSYDTIDEAITAYNEA